MYKIPANSLFMGKQLVFMPECHSTNTLALERCQQEPYPSEGTIIITDNQHAGRGQRGNIWYAAPGENLTFSIILKPTFLAIADQFFLNVITALAVADFLMADGCKEVAVKWPNDVYLNGRKVCGILIESQIRANQMLWSVIGIGLNINQKRFTVSTATSLSVEQEKDYILDDVFGQLVPYIEARYLQLRRLATQELMAEYERRLYWAKELHEFDSPVHGRFEGSISGIDHFGRLRIKVNSNELTFNLKEISFIR